MLFCQIDDRGLQCADLVDHAVDSGAQPQADVGGDLVVARAAGVQALTCVTDLAGQAHLDVEMDVFEVQRPFEFAVADFLQDFFQAAFDRQYVFLADDALCAQHAGVGDRTLDVEFGQTLVEADRGGVTFDQFGYRFVETAGPGLGGCRFCVGIILHDKN